MTEPTKDEVIALWGYMSKSFDSSIVPKADSTLMSIIGSALDLFGVQDKEKFLRSYATTIGTTIYLPFEIGTEPEFGGWTLWSQMSVCVHEHQHVAQYKQEGLSFSASYLSSSANRARYETEAYRCSMELDWWRFGVLRMPEELAGRLVHYGCEKADIDMASKILRLSSETIKRGGVTNESTFVALKWLNANMQHIRAEA